jgi:hypothetical protein
MKVIYENRRHMVPESTFELHDFLLNLYFAEQQKINKFAEHFYILSV